MVNKDRIFPCLRIPHTACFDLVGFSHLGGLQCITICVQSIGARYMRRLSDSRLSESLFRRLSKKLIIGHHVFSDARVAPSHLQTSKRDIVNSNQQVYVSVHFAPSERQAVRSESPKTWNDRPKVSMQCCLPEIQLTVAAVDLLAYLYVFPIQSSTRQIILSFCFGRMCVLTMRGHALHYRTQ